MKFPNMHRLRALITLGLVCSCFETTVHADDLVYLCAGRTLYVIAEYRPEGTLPAVPAGADIHHIHVRDLVQIQVFRDEKGVEGYERTGAETLTKTCGEFEVTISAAWLNSNPLGMLGNYEFATVTIKRGSQTILPRTVLGECDSRLFESLGPCKDAWGVDIFLSWQDGMSLMVKRVIEEWRREP